MENRIMSAVKAIVCCRGRILLVRRSEADSIGAGEWEFPGGRIEFGETPEKALKREISEETGLNVKIKELAYASSFITESRKQIIIITYFCTSNRDIIELSAEHGDYMWVKPEKLYENIGDNIKDDVLKNYDKIEDFINREYV